MKRILYWICPLLFLAACDSPEGNISKLEKAVEAEATVESINELVAAYNEYAISHPDSTERNGRYMYRAASRKYQARSVQDATLQLHKGLSQFPESSVTPQSLGLLGVLYRLNKADRESFNGAIKAVEPKLQNHLDALRADLNSAGNQSLDVDKTRQLANVYVMLTDLLPKGPHTADYLYNMYEFTNSGRMFNDAANACKRLYTEYPDHSKAVSLMFMEGFISENELKDLDRAKAVYEAFLEKHPKSDFADDAQIALANLGKSPEEMLEEILKKKGNQAQ